MVFAACSCSLRKIPVQQHAQDRERGYLVGQMLLVQVRKSTAPGLWQSSHELVAHDVETFMLSSVFLPIPLACSTKLESCHFP